MDRLASSLPNLGVSRPVVNKTGLAGKYDFRLKLVPDHDSSQPAPGVPDSSIIYALQEQLGLDLKSANGPVENFGHRPYRAVFGELACTVCGPWSLVTEGVA